MSRLVLPKHDVECVAFSYAGEGRFYPQSIDRRRWLLLVTPLLLWN